MIDASRMSGDTPDITHDYEPASSATPTLKADVAWGRGKTPDMPHSPGGIRICAKTEEPQ